MGYVSRHQDAMQMLEEKHLDHLEALEAEQNEREERYLAHIQALEAEHKALYRGGKVQASACAKRRLCRGKSSLAECGRRSIHQ